MSKLGRIATMISLDIETKSMFNDLRMQGINMSASIREHIRWLYASRMGTETKTWVESHWESLQEDKREYEDALNKILEQEHRFVANLPRNIAMHEKSQAMLSHRDYMRKGRFSTVKRFVEKLNDPEIDDMDVAYSNEYIQMKEWANGAWNEMDWGPCPDFLSHEGRVLILEELEELNRKFFFSKASIDQIEIQLESEGNIPDLIAGNIANNLLPEGDEL